ncbi:MAG: metalloregulator ArsR/SmtB family transcription factor [Chloroflexi bacterium]|nr:metalloregulator ArsR/SmtB family transcription factor [Chloroflexota bacterium]
MRELVRVSKALSDENRIRMLKLLLEKDICVCEMQEIFPLSPSQVSRSLKALMDAGFLKRWREGKCVVYVADRDGSSKYCRALLDVLADSFNDGEAVSRDRERLHQVIAEQVRERKK